MTTDRTAAPVRPTPSERSTAVERSPAAAGFVDLPGGAHAASSRPATRTASQRHEQAPQINTPAPFLLTIATPPAAPPRAVPVTAAELVRPVPALEPAPTGAVAASARAAAPAAEAQPAGHGRPAPGAVAASARAAAPAAEAQPPVPARAASEAVPALPAAAPAI